MDDEQKLKLLKQISDPLEVQSRLKKYGIDKVYVSTRKDKKYMIKLDDGKTIHFGQMGYEDATKHKDKQRILNFKSRNAKWADSPKFSPAWISYHILW